MHFIASRHFASVMIEPIFSTPFDRHKMYECVTSLNDSEKGA